MFRNNKKLTIMSWLLGISFHFACAFVILVVTCCVIKFPTPFSSLGIVTSLLTVVVWWATFAKRKQCIRLIGHLRNLNRMSYVARSSKNIILNSTRLSIVVILIICFVPATSSAILIYNTDSRSARCNECWFNVHSMLGKAVYTFFLQTARQLVNWGFVYCIASFYSCVCLKLDSSAQKLLEDLEFEDEDSIYPHLVTRDSSTNRPKPDPFQIKFTPQLSQRCLKIGKIHYAKKETIHDEPTYHRSEGTFQNDSETHYPNRDPFKIKSIHYPERESLHNGSTYHNEDSFQNESTIHWNSNPFQKDSYNDPNQEQIHNKCNHHSIRSSYRLLVKTVCKLEDSMSFPILLVFCSCFNELYRSMTHCMFHFQINAPPHLIILAGFYMAGSIITFVSVIFCADRLQRSCVLLRKAMMDRSGVLCGNRQLPERLRDDLELLEDKDNIQLTAWGMFEVKKGIVVTTLASLVSYTVVLGQIKI